MTNQLDRTLQDSAPDLPVGRAGTPRRQHAGPSVAIISAAVAVVYAVTGLLTLRLAQMTGLGSPVWPSAGVAFAAALVWHWRALPGILIGSAGANFFSLTLVGIPAADAWPTGATIGIGAVLGAAVGAALVYRCVGPVRRLDTPRAVILTLALGGLLATTIAPTIGVAAQLINGVLGTRNAAFGWLTWWVGDSIGVIVFAPLVLMLLPSQNEHWVGRRWKIAVPSLLIFAILMAAVVQNIARDRARIETAVQQLGDQAAANLARNIAIHQEVLEGVRGLADANPTLTAEEFAAYTDDILMRFPNLQALSWNPVVIRADLADFESRQRAQPGREDFTVTERDTAGNLRPVSPRPEYIVVTYIQPLADNRSAVGFDIYSNPWRAVAIERARDTGRPTATGPIDLVQESGTQKGMLALLPVYQGGTDPGSEAARRATLRGFAVGVYRLGDLLAETFRGADWDSVNVTLIDVSDRAKPIAIADLPARAPAATDQVSKAPTATTEPLDIYGRSWELTVRPTSAAFTESRNGIMAALLLAALAVTLLLEAFLLVLSGMESLARRLMTELSGAARYVGSILPRDLNAPVPVDSRYVPSEQLGGDSFDYRWIDDDHLMVYLIDVSGHGIAPAMFSISVHNLLRSGTLDDRTLRDPGLVLNELNRLFQMEQQAGHYFTIWYGVYQHSNRTLRYAGAGHPPALVLHADGSTPVRLPSDSIPIGVTEDTVFDSAEYSLPADSTLLLYSDGVLELAVRDGRHWTLDDFVGLCARTARSPQWGLDDLIDDLRDRSKGGQFIDDCTMVRVTVR